MLIVRAAVLLVVSLATMGCTLLTVFDQSFVEITTPHFVVMSSLNEKRTEKFAVELEAFRSGVEVALGLQRSPESVRMQTQVYLFDEITLGQSFSFGGEKATLLPGLEAPTLVIRRLDGWGEEVSRDVRHLYAHELARRSDPTRRPLWLAEGLAHFASTAIFGDEVLVVGKPIRVHVRALRDRGVPSPFRMLQVETLAPLSERGRMHFEASAWGLVHFLVLRAGPPIESTLSAYRETLDGGAAVDLGATSIGEYRELARTFRRYARMNQFDEINVAPFVAWEPGAVKLRAVPADEVRERLARVAFELGHEEIAIDYFERALASNPENARARSGLARCAAASGHFDLAQGLLERALQTAPGDFRVQLDAGEVQLVRARAQSGSERRAGLARSREYLGGSAEASRASPEASASMARTYLVDGEDPAAGLVWVEAARRLSPASLEVELLAARFAATLGSVSSACAAVQQVLSRSHWPPTESAARALLTMLGPDCQAEGSGVAEIRQARETTWIRAETMESASELAVRQSRQLGMVHRPVR